MMKSVSRLSVLTLLATSFAWADSASDSFGLGKILQRGLYGDPFSCASQYKALYGVPGSCSERTLMASGIFAPFSMDSFLNGVAPVMLVAFTLVLADFYYRRRVLRRKAATTS